MKQIVLFLLLYLISPTAFAQSEEDDSFLQDEYFRDPAKEQQLNRETYRKEAGGLDYTDHRKKEPEKEKQQQRTYQPLPSLNISEQTFKVISVVVLLTILITVLLKAFGFSFSFGRKKEIAYTDATFQDFTDETPLTELEHALKEALLRKEFRLAVRIYYLMLIRELADRRLIIWRKEKTNYDYVLELTGNDHYRMFKENTLVFERVWYGDRSVDEGSFNEISQRFIYFLTALKS